MMADQSGLDDEFERPHSWLSAPVAFGGDRSEKSSQAERQQPPDIGNFEPQVRTTVGERRLPSVVVVPAHPTPPRGVDVEPATLLNGAEVVVVFSNVQALIDRLGNAQPWIMLPAAMLTRQLAAQSVTAIVLDPAPGVVQPRWSSSRIKLLGEVLG